MQGNGVPRPGKLGERGLRDVVFRHLGARDPSVSWGPGPGRDFNAVDICNGFSLLMTTDPLYVNPIFGLVDATWFGFQILLADMLTSGIDPDHAIFSLNLPGTMNDATFKITWDVLHAECEERGISIVSGHTGRYDGCDFPIVGAGTLLATCTTGAHVSIGNIRPGDAILLAGNPGAESFASLLKVDEQGGQDVFGRRHASATTAAWEALSVEPAIEVLRSGARAAGMSLPALVSGLHDVAEGGVFRAVHEICDGTGLGCMLDVDQFSMEESFSTFMNKHFPDPADAWIASGQGALIITCRQDHAGNIVDMLADRGLPAGCIGAVLDDCRGRHATCSGHAMSLDEPWSDPFWPAFTRLLEDQRGA